MTGFGTGTTALGGGRLTVEIRSVNHRHIDLRFDLPEELASIALEIEPWLRAQLVRGRHDVVARLTTSTSASLIDRERAAAIYRELSSLRDELAPGTELAITALTSVGEVFRRTPAFGRHELLEAFRAAATTALAGLVTMRQVEGASLATDIRGHVAEARRRCDQIALEVPRSIEAARQRLLDRIRRLLDPSITANPARLELELVLFADRTDVSEELARLESHLRQLEQLLDAAEPVGRKLDFLTQELMREANTTGSKSQSAAIAHAVVELKTAIERIREQVQNLE
ncbi:MAG: YicC family protein [Deltaproteobacteria bacterium]|nr:YicC family protein [Deltaproteobacteria bacterium]